MPTQGNALAGSLAATFEATEVYKLVSGEREYSIAGSEALFDARHQKHYLSRLDRNPHCRFSHEHISLRETQDLTLAAAFELTPGASAEKRLSVPDSTFVTRLVCVACGHEEKLLRLRESLEVFSLACPGCAKPRPVRGFDLVERLFEATLSRESLSLTLVDLGFRPGEVFSVEGKDGRHFFVLGDSAARGTHEVGGALVVVGGLGNTGSYLAPHVARMEEVARVVLCDPDIYEPGQQIGQDIPADAVGRGKAAVQAERLRAIRPELQVEVFPARVEHLPLGRLQGAIVASCLDSRAARQRLAARAWRVGSPFVDAAVGGGSSLLIRTNVYVPEPDAACFECAFDARDYEDLEQVFPCAEKVGGDANGSPSADQNRAHRSAGTTSA